MNYLHLVTWSPRKTFGGYETIIRTTAQKQIDLGYKAIICARTMGKKHRVTSHMLNGVKYVEVEDRFKRRPSTLDVNSIGLLLLILEILYSVFILTPQVIKIVKKEKIDIVIFYGIHLFLISPILKLMGTKTMLGLEVIQKNPYPSKLSILFWFRILKYRLFNGIFTYTHYFHLSTGQIIDNLALLRYYAGTVPVFYIPWGIDLSLLKKIKRDKSIEMLKRNKKQKIIICPRRLVEEKGVRYLLEAIPMVLKKSPRTTFIFAGDGILKNQLLSRSKQLGIEDHVIFTGFLDHTKTLSYIKASDVVVVPSSGEESFGMVFLEAYALKIPIISTWFGGISNVVQHKKTGILVRPMDSNSLAKEIIKMIEDKGKSKKFVEEGAILLKKQFLLETTVKKLDNSVKQL